VYGTAKLLHAKKWPSLLVKVDIAWAFDFIAWPFLLAGWTGCRSCSRQRAPKCCLTVCQGRGYAMVEACGRVTHCHPCSSYWLWNPLTDSFIGMMLGGCYNLCCHDSYRTTPPYTLMIWFSSRVRWTLISNSPSAFLPCLRKHQVWAAILVSVRSFLSDVMTAKFSWCTTFSHACSS
jgi:hypothetical protein